MSVQDKVILAVRMAAILIAGKDWTARALLRAQLIEEGFDVEAYEAVGDAVKHLLSSRAMPSLLIVDLFDSENPTEDIAVLSQWVMLLPVWILAGHGTAWAEALEVRGFEKVLYRPLDVGRLVQEIKGRLAA